MVRECVSGSYDGARFWDPETGETILGPLKLTNVEAAVCSPDETMIAAGGTGDLEDIGFIKIWNTNTGKLVINLGFTEPVLCLETEKRSFSGQMMAKLAYGMQPLGSMLQF
jgi:WD40 repeat protein